MQKDSSSFADRIRDIAVLELLFATGIRVSELCSLKSTNVCPMFSYITVNGKGRKERTLPIPNESVKASLREYHKLFTNGINHHFFIQLVYPYRPEGF